MRHIADRYILLEAMMRARTPMSIAELVETLESRGVQTGPSANKWVSDLLRSDLRRGRVVRVSRGLYGLGVMPPSTASYKRRSGRGLRTHRSP